MSKIFELFGYRLDRWNDEAIANLREAWCPFMNAECDGGGNRYLSALNLELEEKKELRKHFAEGKKKVQSGVCSLRLRESESPWIVCPRRLLSLRGEVSSYQQHVKNRLIEYSGLKKDNLYRVWSEVKMKVETQNDDNESKSFDYTFDYIIAGSSKKSLDDISLTTGETRKKIEKTAQNNGYTMTFNKGDLWIEDFPSDPIIIVEIMTSSTSGGNKEDRTQIAMACEDAIKHLQNHKGPGINYRQVWARMVSQLIVKSQVGMAWNGKTFWLLQDLLADYISATTALDLSKYISKQSDEVNILAFGYGDVDRKDSPLIELENSVLYAGPITEKANDKTNDKIEKTNAEETKGFIEIVKIVAPPDKKLLWRSLFNKCPCGSLDLRT